MVRYMSDQLPPPPQAPHHPQAGLPAYPGPAQDPGHGYGPQAPQRMPGVVRAAQIITWVLAGLTVLGSALAVAVVNPETGGAALGVNLCLLVTAGMAFRFGSVGNGIRVTCIVLMSVQTALGLGGAANGNPVGLLPLLGAIAVVVLLSQGAAGAWFKRPRAHG